MKRIVVIVLLALPFTVIRADADTPLVDEWQFDVSINDRFVGTHAFTVTRSGEVEEIDIEARFSYRLLFVKLLDYVHRNQEVWRAGCLERIESTSKMNGDRYFVRGERQDAGLAVVNQEGVTNLDDCVQTFAYWNPEILKAQRLLNSQTGEHESVRVSSIGEEVLSIVGAQIPTHRYRIELEGNAIDVWYTQASQTWVALTTVTAEGRIIQYTPTEVPSGVLTERLVADAERSRKEVVDARVAMLGEPSDRIVERL